MRKLKNEELNRLSVEGFRESEKNPLVLVLDNVRSLSNIGSVFRTADAFRIEKIYLCGITACPPHREIHKTALGATESVSWEYFENSLMTVRDLQASGYTCIAIEQAENSIMLDTFNPSPDARYAFILGNEVTGVEDDLMKAADACVEIPQFGTKHSLNIAVSAGIVVWDFFCKINSFKQAK